MQREVVLQSVLFWKKFPVDHLGLNVMKRVVEEDLQLKNNVLNWPLQFGKFQEKEALSYFVEYITRTGCPKLHQVDLSRWKHIPKDSH